MCVGRPGYNERCSVRSEDNHRAASAARLSSARVRSVLHEESNGRTSPGKRQSFGRTYTKNFFSWIAKNFGGKSHSYKYIKKNFRQSYESICA